MNCSVCDGIAKRRGFYTNKNFTVQRYECLKCGLSFSQKQPLDNLRVEFQQACKVMALISEGMGIRATSRLTGLHQQTVLNVLARTGSKAKRFLEATVKEVKPVSVEADEMWCYVKCKEKRNFAKNQFIGDQYLFLAIDSGSKLIISHLIGKRTESNTERFLANLNERVAGRMQLTTDGFDAYKAAVRRSIGAKNVDYAQIVKVYATSKVDMETPERRYSPACCIAVRKHVRHGTPNEKLVSTSYVERANLSVRLFNRRFTRLTIGFSKKFEYLSHSINFMVFHYNFCRIHSKHGHTPAQAAGLTDHTWTIEELLKHDPA